MTIHQKKTKSTTEEKDLPKVVSVHSSRSESFRINVLYSEFNMDAVTVVDVVGFVSIDVDRSSLASGSDEFVFEVTRMFNYLDPYVVDFFYFYFFF